MPPRKRQQQQASALQSGRLPVGTHLPGTTLTSHSLSSRPTSRATDHSESSSFHRGASSDFDASSDFEPQQHASTKHDPTSAAAMSNPNPTPAQIADAKLRRQQERIDQADPTLQPAHHQQRAHSRVKGKATYKPLDIDWDTAETSRHQIDDATAPALAGPVAEVRINTYSAQPIISRDTSLSRSLSGLSQQTGGVEVERHDSFDDDGFQTYRPRGRGPKPAEQLKPFEDKPEQKQKTVEAEFDKRRIYEVFAKDLPGLDFIDSNMGQHDGQVQFIQHPNGDVSAHIWSTQRTLWENLGSYSNIRKKIEGQLAADRLKGETGWQTLLKHTLAYFRAVAKQREWTRMGINFTQADIQKLLPQPRGSAAALVKEAASVPAPAPNPFKATTDQTAAPQRSTSSILQPTPLQPGANRFLPLHESPADDTDEDPFTAAGSYTSPSEVSLRAEPSHSSVVQPKTILPRGSSLGGTSSASNAPSVPAVPAFTLFKTGHSTSNAGPASQQLKPRTTVGGSTGFPFLSPNAGTAAACHASIRRGSSFDNLGSPSRPRPVTPLQMQTREAMRDQLWKLGETARSRNPSLNNIPLNTVPVRTVLRDPFSRSTTETDASDNYPNSSLPTERTAKYPTYGSFPNGWTDSQVIHHQAPRASHSFDEDILAGSVPDLAVSPTAASSSANSTVVARPELGAMPTFDDLLVYKRPGGAPEEYESYQESLQRWWTSGNKFARQEELFQSIKAQALLEGSTATTPARTNPLPIGAPGGRTVANPSGGIYVATAKKPTCANQPAPFNETTTRALLLVHENLSSYVQGPSDPRSDYWAPWVKAPEWAIDRSPGGNNSFFDDGWGKPPARVGRDPRYRALPGELRFGGFSPGGPNIGSPPGMMGVSGGVHGMARYGYGSPAGHKY